MGALHEVLAVEQELKAEAGRVINDVSALFREGAKLLVGQRRTYRPLEDGGDPQPDENVRLGTTVQKQLTMVREAFGQYLDVTIQKELTNTEAFGNISGVNITFDELPATALLNLESRLGEIRKLVATIPTLDPTLPWTWNEDIEAYVSDERVQYRTEKQPYVLTKAEASEHHPAQTEVFNRDVRVGEFTQVIECGMLPSSTKRQYLTRIELLITAVKKARQRANSVEVKTVAVADTIFDFIFKE